MINKLKGIVTEKTEKTISLSILSTITFECIVVNADDFQLGEEYSIYCAMLFSAEKGYVLYGFLELIQKQYFMLLQDCHGVGAKLALQILLHLSVNHVYDAIITENKVVFEGISGIGKKKAEMIILELKSKIVHLTTPTKEGLSLFHNDFVASLRALGYSQKEVASMVQAVYKETRIKDLSLSQLIESALLLKNNL